LRLSPSSQGEEKGVRAKNSLAVASKATTNGANFW